MKAQQTIKYFKEVLTTDQEYTETWKANIAMAFIDSEHSYKQETGKKYLNGKDKHIIANNAAENFLNNFCSKN